MALRKSVSSAYQVSGFMNNFVCEKSLFSAVSLVCRNFNHSATDVGGVVPYQAKHPLLSPEVQQAALCAETGGLLTSESNNSTNQVYKCPSRLSQRFSEIVIMDQQIKSDYHLPLATVVTSIIDPQCHNHATEISDPLSSEKTLPKEAKEILRIRHKKMKKHKLRKLRKRMYFLWRKQKMARKAKRDGIYWNEINSIKKEGEDFDAESFVKEQLQKARRGGYYINVLDSRH